MFKRAPACWLPTTRPSLPSGPLAVHPSQSCRKERPRSVFIRQWTLDSPCYRINGEAVFCELCGKKLSQRVFYVPQPFQLIPELWSRPLRWLMSSHHGRDSLLLPSAYIVPCTMKRKEAAVLFRKMQTALLSVPAFVQTLLILHASFVYKVLNIQYHWGYETKCVRNLVVAVVPFHRR